MLNLFPEEETKSSYIQSLEESLGEEFNNLSIVTTVDEANYIVGKIKKLQEQKTEVEDVAKRALSQYKDKVEMFLAKEQDSLDYQIERLQDILQPYIIDQLENSSKKSIRFIEGTAGFRKQSNLIEHDDEKLEQEVKGIDDNKYFKTTVKFSWSELKKDLKFKDGKVYLGDQVLEGVSYEEQSDQFYVK